MRLQTNGFATAGEALDARKQFPYCGRCGADLKVQHAGLQRITPTGELGTLWELTCVERPGHTVSISDRGRTK